MQKHLLDDVEPIIADVKSEVADLGKTIKARPQAFPRRTTPPRIAAREARRTSWLVQLQHAQSHSFRS